MQENTVNADYQKAQVWIKQAEHDLTALEILARQVNARKGVSAHACFLAHQVAEKALKAGMYKLVGLHPNALKFHQLHGLACAIEQEKPFTAGLSDLARTLESYYLDARYPNRYCPVKVPSDQYTPEEAKRALTNARSILALIHKLF